MRTMTDRIRFAIAAVLMLCGVISSGIAILGVFRFRFVMNRMHCAAILDTLGMAGILCGLMVLSGDPDAIAKLLCALMLLWIGSPLASHLVAKMEITTDETADAHISAKEDYLDGSD